MIDLVIEDRKERVSEGKMVFCPLSISSHYDCGSYTRSSVDGLTVINYDGEVVKEKFVEEKEEKEKEVFRI